MSMVSVRPGAKPWRPETDHTGEARSPPSTLRSRMGAVLKGSLPGGPQRGQLWAPGLQCDLPGPGGGPSSWGLGV